VILLFKNREQIDTAVPVDEEENIRILWYNKEKCKNERMVIYEGLKRD